MDTQQPSDTMARTRRAPREYVEVQASVPLEPRVAKLEVGLDRLTADVSNLATVVREQGASMESEIQKLVVAVTQAAGPRKTDWSTIIAAVMMVMAIGAAVLIPLNNATQDNKAALERHHESLVEHQRLDMHPVGLALVQRMEGQLASHIANNDKQFKEHIESDEKEITRLEANNKEHLACMDKFHDAKISLVTEQIKGIQGKNDLYIDKLFGRVIELEKERVKIADNEHGELMMWRQKAMGLSTPDAYVPLIKRETPETPQK